MNPYSKKIAIISILLIIFGILAMYSVSIYESFTVSKGITNYFYFQQHIQKIWFGIILSLITRSIPRKTLKKGDIILFLMSFVLLLLLFSSLWDNLTNTNKNVRLRLYLPWWTLQPGEFFKLWFVFFLSNRLPRKQHQFSELWFFLGSLFLIIVLCIVFMFLPDFGTILILWIVGMMMYRYMGWKIYYILVAGMLWFGAIMLVESKIDYIHKRIEYFIDPSQDKTSEGIGYQINNALTAAGGGGFWGRGYGKWLQKFWNLPESQSDFIFAAFLEEVWFVWGTILITLYFLLAWYTIKGLSLLDDNHDKVLWFGMLSLILVQACINMGVNINLLPLTGLTLPFISHGWSALLVNMIEVTLLMKIINQKATKRI